MKIPKLNFPDRAFSAFSLAIIGAAVAMLVAGVIYYAQQAEQKRAIDKQTEKTNELILQVKVISEQNRELGQQNKELSEQSRNYAYCNSSVLARYTQDLQPIIIDDLNKCLFTSYPRETQVESNGLFFTNPYTAPVPTLPNGKPVPPKSNR